MAKLMYIIPCRVCSRFGFIITLIGFASFGIYMTHHHIQLKLSKPPGAHFHGDRIKEIAHPVHHLTDYDQRTPYVPVNKLLYNMYYKQDSGYAIDAIRENIMDAIRSGQSLFHNESSSCSSCWVENHVEFRPPERAVVSEKFPSPYVPEVVPFVPFEPSVFFHGRTPPDVDRMQRKIILWYTKTRYAKFMDDLEPLRFCPDFPCFMTTNRKFENQSSAMVFAGEIIKGKAPDRTPEQVFVFSNHEPATANWWSISDIKHDELRWKDAFNWTMTYRLDSDVTAWYGIVRRRKAPLRKNYTAILSRKTKFAAWIVSNCNTISRREKYVAELQKYIPVDVYGQCGKYRCPRSDDEKCLENISTLYKFYLAFESSICEDYVTEKFFRYLASDAVIVARASNDIYRHAPSEIYLNAADFSSPKDLADRMLYLDSHDEDYLSMLKEKDKYMVIHEDYTIRNEDGSIKYITYHYESVPFCEVCYRLWNLDRYRKSIPDIRHWFREKMCREPTDLTF